MNSVQAPLKWLFRIYKAGYGGYPDASTTCWDAQRHVTEDVAHIRVTGPTTRTHIKDYEWRTALLTHTDIREIEQELDDATHHRPEWNTRTLHKLWAKNLTSHTHTYLTNGNFWEMRNSGQVWWALYLIGDNCMPGFVFAKSTVHHQAFWMCWKIANLRHMSCWNILGFFSLS